MAGVKGQTRVTFAELEAWPDDGRRYELYDGEAVVVPAPNLRHQWIVANLFKVLNDYQIRVGGCVVISPFDIILSDYDVLQPDIVYFGPAKRALLNPKTGARVVPDLAVEVLSASTESRDRGRKLELLARYGLREYWLVDPERQSLEAYVRDIQGRLEVISKVRFGQAFISPTLEGLNFVAACIFDEP
jgi:Uma2 family endonuclease